MARSGGSCLLSSGLQTLRSCCYYLILTWGVVSLATGVQGVSDVSGGAKLSLPRALLPLGVQPPQLHLHVSGTTGCYSWSSSRDDVVSLTVLESTPGCSNSVIIKGYPHITKRQTVIVFAEDRYTQQILRCDVIIDKISHLEIVTTTREFFVEEAPEAFEVRAYDDQDNEFTTLDGIEFSWTIDSSLKNSDVIRIITFSESSYETTDTMKEMEIRGLRGHIVLLEGVSTGTAKVTVKLVRPEYSDVKSAEVTLRVVANLLIFPPDASIMQLDPINFKIIQVREGRLIEVPQPSSQYWLEIVDSSIADLDRQTGLTIGKNLGSTKILLKDAGEADNDDDAMLRPPEANLRVVTPHSLQLELRPLPTSRIWSIQCEADVTIIVHILDSQGKRIYVGPETRVGVKLDESMLEVKSRSINGTIVNGIARQAGVVPIVATLLSVAGVNVKSKITATGEIHIYNKIEIIPPVSILPYDSIYNRKSEIQLKAVGGDGVYVWRGEGAATVDPRGLVTAQEIGNATVIASMPSNAYIYGTASVLVADPINMEVVWYEEEGPVGSSLAIHMALFTQLTKSGSYVPFTRCNLMPFNIVSYEGIHFGLLELSDDEDTPKESACVVLHVQCTESGSGSVKIQLGKLSVNLSLRCYAPLQRLYPSPEDASIVLAVGSSINTIFTGGPISWFNRDVDKPDINVELSEVAEVRTYNLPVDNSLQVYTVKCLEIGETKAHIKMFGNNAYSNMAVSKAVEATLHIYCSQPHSVKMVLKNEFSSCPTSSSQLMVLSGMNTFEVEVAIYNSNGLQFHNASSLEVKLSAKPAIILSNVHAGHLLIKTDKQYGVPIVDYHYEELRINMNELHSRSGMGEIDLEVIPNPNIVSKPRASLPLRLIKPVQTSDKVVVFNYVNSKTSIPLSDGSGHFQISYDNSNHAKVYLDGTGHIKIEPISDGDMTVVISDLCLNSPPAILQISIVSIANIITDIPELIEKGKAVLCKVYYYDTAGYIIPTNIEGAPALISTVTSGHINVNPNKAQKASNDALLYTVTGIEVGDANIIFTAGNVQGLAHTYVFPPLKLVPQMSIILPGGNVKIGVIGGPPSPGVIKFKRNATVADVIDINSNGVVRGLGIGTARVEAYADGFKGAETTKAYAKVQVLPLEGITIHAPTTTLLIGNTMPLWAMGIPESLTPIELGSLKPALHFRWSISGEGSVTITDTLGLTGVEFDDVDRVAVHLTALKPGNVMVHLNVTTVPGSVIARTCGYSWYAKYDLSVVEPLKITNPPVNVFQMLLPTHSSLNLKTNYPVDRVTYSLIETVTKSTMDGPLAKITADGKLVTFGRLGFGTIMVDLAETSLSPKQYTSISFEVCSPHYSMMELEKDHDWNRLSGLGSLPSGLTLPLKLSMYDIVGRKFETLVNNILQTTNRPDLILSLTNSSNLHKVLLAETGQAVMKLWDVSSDKKFSDYLSVKISSAIYPQKIQATVGDVWCMQSTVKGSIWTENSSGAVWISQSGMTQARISQVAATTLILQMPTNLPYSTQAVVVTRPADLVYFIDTTKVPVVTDEKPYIAYLLLANHEEQNKVNNLLFGENNCMDEEIDYFPFSCEVRHSEDFSSKTVSVMPVFNKNKGSYGCKVTWSPDPSSPVTVNNTCSVNVIAKSGGSVSDPLFIRCIRSIKVKPDNVVLSPPPAQLTPIDLVASSEVLKQLKLWTESDALIVDGPLKLSDVSIRYIIRGSSKSSNVQKANIRLVSLLTNQNDEISVTINDGLGSGGECVYGGGSAILQILEKYQFIFLLIITLIALFAATIYVYGNFIIPLRQSHSESPMNVTLTNDTSNLRNLSYQSRSPLSRSLGETNEFSQHEFSPNLHHVSGSTIFDTSGSAVYGDPSFLASGERRRNRRFL